MLNGRSQHPSNLNDFNEANGNYVVNNPEQNQENDKDGAEQEKGQYYSSRRGQYNKRSKAQLNVNQSLGELDILNDTQTVIPTKGAIVMAEFLTAYGQKIMLTLNSTQWIPFGTTTKLKNNDPVPEGIVDDRQRVFLSGVPAEGKVIVEWKGNSCEAAYSIIENNGAAVNFITADCR